MVVLLLEFDFFKIYYNLDILFYIFFYRSGAPKNEAQAPTDNRTVYKATITFYSISGVHLGSS
jgi:hypothetical protein